MAIGNDVLECAVLQALNEVVIDKEKIIAQITKVINDVVKKQKVAKNGEIVVAMTEENEVTLKRFYKESDHIRLQPENDTMEPIIVEGEGLLARAICHEYDHLDGILYVDRVEGDLIDTDENYEEVDE